MYIEEITNLRNRLNILGLSIQDITVRKLSGGVPQDRVLEVLDSLKTTVQSPPHYPMRLVEKLAGKLEISMSQARRLLDFLKKENLVSYSCKFEAESDSQRETVLEVNYAYA